MRTRSSHRHHKLGQWSATAICGNDILSSALYVSGIAILYAGVYAPLILLFISFVLFLYKKVYTEVVEALPVNGGAYNCLLNGTSKTVAAVAGVMTLLSYVATAVISAKVGVEYLNIGVEHLSRDLLGHAAALPTIPVTIGVLLLFALLVIAGVKDSAKVALAIFVVHVATLLLFAACGIAFVLHGSGQFSANVIRTAAITHSAGGLIPTLFLAFSASLLGVSGFESSANFVEEQGKGVFRKTLRNMLIGVTIFNPLIAWIVLQAMPYNAITSAKDFLLADAARAIGGTMLQYLIVVDAFLVLCGAVLTAYVGVSGLLHRMSADRCLPSFFAKQSSRGSFPRIILSFFLLCSSILLLTRGNLLSLAGVYTIAFLGVMSMFAIGNLILKEARKDLKRTYRAPVPVVVGALLATLLGIVGNIYIDPLNLRFFELYFIPSVLLVLGMVYQDRILKLALRITQDIPVAQRYLQRHFSALAQGRFVAFIHHVGRLHPILEYIDRNETGCDITLVHCHDEQGTDENFRAIRDALPTLREAGFFQHFTITLLYLPMPFGPQAIDEASRILSVNKNRILIGSIHDTHRFDYADLGGLRIIFG